MARNFWFVWVGAILMIADIAALFLLPNEWGLLFLIPGVGLLFFAPAAIGAILMWKGFGLALPKLSGKKVTWLVITLFIVAVLFVFWLNSLG